MNTEQSRSTQQSRSALNHSFIIRDFAPNSLLPDLRLVLAMLEQPRSRGLRASGCFRCHRATGARILIHHLRNFRTKCTRSSSPHQGGEKLHRGLVNPRATRLAVRSRFWHASHFTVCESITHSRTTRRDCAEWRPRVAVARLPRCPRRQRPNGAAVICRLALSRRISWRCVLSALVSAGLQSKLPRSWLRGTPHEEDRFSNGSSAGSSERRGLRDGRRQGQGPAARRH